MSAKEDKQFLFIIRHGDRYDYAHPKVTYHNPCFCSLAAYTTRSHVNVDPNVHRVLLVA